MNFRVADTFADNLAKLTNEERQAVKTTFDLQMNPANQRMEVSQAQQSPGQEFLVGVYGVTFGSL